MGHSTEHVGVSSRMGDNDLRLLRHAVATYLISRGIALGLVQAILGHSASRMTTEVYTHLVAADHGAALELLAALLPAG